MVSDGGDEVGLKHDAGLLPAKDGVVEPLDEELALENRVLVEPL